MKINKPRALLSQLMSRLENERTCITVIENLRANPAKKSDLRSDPVGYRVIINRLTRTLCETVSL